MSWEQLISIREQSRDELLSWQNTPPQACPNDGEPLQPGTDPGTLHCPWDGWTWPVDYGRR